MTVLRSREVRPPKSQVEPLTNQVNIEPASPSQIPDDNRRRARLILKSSVPSDGDNYVNKKRKLVVSENLLGLKGEDSEEFLNLRSGRKVLKRIVDNDGDKLVNGREVGGKGKGKVVELEFEVQIDKKGKRILREVSEEGVAVFDTMILKSNQNGDGSFSEKRVKRFGREEKGKAKLVDEASIANRSNGVEMGVECEAKIPATSGTKHLEGVVKKASVRMSDSRMEQFRVIARQNASRFAYFSSQDGEENHSSMDNENLVPDGEVEREIEDWPGPFSTAMKIIRDRGKKLNGKQEISSLGYKKHTPIPWVPRKGWSSVRQKLIIPSLKELCLKILVQNADAITSLENVPDALRHKLSRMLCDSRGMNSHFLNLLVRGSPTEIRLGDCSWLTEGEFTQAFERCDTSKLTVLQLDRCGRCLPDYVLLSTLARSLNSLPSLTTLSLCGACRLSDAGFRALVSSASSLRSINLSQCSLLTPTSINILADSLGSFIQELYINDCQSLNAMLILPALKKLNHLEVLSIAGIENVSDDFVRELVSARGHNMRELVFSDCVKLTDFSMKVIAESCPRLCTLDVCNLYKLTDSAIRYLANGCRAIETLKLCRNAFSDEAIATFLEICGESLKELSLNNVKQVSHGTALSLARRSRNLLSLDLSWCRDLTDEAVGLIVDSCLSLRILKLFGCTQITNVFLNGHSNPNVQVIGLKMSPVLDHIKVPDFQEGPLQYSSVLSSM